jgi:predicted dienelactone hydrolase
MIPCSVRQCASASSLCPVPVPGPRECVWSQISHMNPRIDRRKLVVNTLQCAVGLGVAGATNVAFVQNSAAKGSDRFSTIVQASTGAVAAGFSDFAVQSPEGNTCTARLAYPLVQNKRLPLLMFCPDEGTQANQYDLLTGALAAQGFFVMAIDRRPTSAPAARPFLSPEQQNDERLRRFAEARFLLDTIDAAAAVLGPNSELVDTSRVGAICHGDGAWVAAGLGGWDHNGAASTRTRDGRIYAIFGLTPNKISSAAAVPAQRSPDGVSGMFAGILADMPTPARDSGLLGLSLPLRATNFGGLIGTAIPNQSRRSAAEPQALAAAVASAVLFFDWTLRGNRNAKRDLMSLDGRRVEGLEAPLQLRKA